MGYENLLRVALGGEAVPYVVPEAKFLVSQDGLTFPVLFCAEREKRPFRAYEAQTRANCSLCAVARAKRTSSAVLAGMEWLAASWPIKAYHGICYPAEHRAAILAEDICQIGTFVDAAGDAVACINLRGSAASVPEHFHAQIHHRAVFPNREAQNTGAAFPLLDCPMELLKSIGRLALYRLPVYPAFVLIVQGPWELLGNWLTIYLAASNARPHNFALAAGGRLVVIPRGLEKAPAQENRYGASEMLGLVTPVTHDAYCAIQSAEVIVESLRLCGLSDRQEQIAVEEHAIWVMEYLHNETNRHQ
ncbi:MAG TPA: hypothetical protein VKP08_07615 [Anaerolineales bacterium]|nr:hypothetical protein [Anaerolineales bacterium]